jgi:hypothetical protein
VCGLADRRALLEVRLSSGDEVTLCGTHELIHRRSVQKAATRGELVAFFRDKRAGRVDRRRGEGDELAMMLHRGFSGERRATDRRRG